MERARKGMEAKDLTRNCGAGNEKSSRETAAIGKNAHSYPETRVPNKASEVKEFLGSFWGVGRCRSKRPKRARLLDRCGREEPKSRAPDSIGMNSARPLHVLAARAFGLGTIGFGAFAGF